MFVQEEMSLAAICLINWNRKCLQRPHFYCCQEKDIFALCSDGYCFLCRDFGQLSVCVRTCVRVLYNKDSSGLFFGNSKTALWKGRWIIIQKDKLLTTGRAPKICAS
ncbi:UNVERIFIED_CONTAM: hypothetical protein K2H54_017862 [Gekko kuhli]